MAKNRFKTAESIFNCLRNQNKLSYIGLKKVRTVKRSFFGPLQSVINMINVDRGSEILALFYDN
jgi:hypothetical protein